VISRENPAGLSQISAGCLGICMLSLGTGGFAWASMGFASASVGFGLGCLPVDLAVAWATARFGGL